MVLRFSMLWGTFTLTHFITLAIGLLLILGLYGLGRLLKDPYRKWVYFGFSLLGYGAIIFNLVMWHSPLEYLPLELCSFNAMILPIVVLSKNKVLGNCLLLWSLGALIALIVNNGAANFDIFSWTFFWYYFPHVIEFGLPILLVRFGYIELKAKYIATTMGITLVLYTLVYFCNVGLNRYFAQNDIRDYKGDLIQVNYMFSICGKNEINPLVIFLHSIIPFNYWHMYLAAPVILLYLGSIYYVHYLVGKHKQKKLEDKSPVPNSEAK